MAATFVREIVLPDLSATHRLGASLSAALQPGDTVLLSGPMGAGKSELARAIIRTLARAEVDVPSPTFTLVQSYDTPGLLVTHADLYRIGAAAELPELGLDEALEAGAILVEWPDRAEGQWPDSRLEIEIVPAATNDGRLARLTGRGDWAQRLATLTS
jgi:tRNA threonylcarbamoyl adenosine modification protein YjeE